MWLPEAHEGSLLACAPHKQWRAPARGARRPVQDFSTLPWGSCSPPWPPCSWWRSPWLRLSAVEAGMRSPGSSPLVSPEEMIIVQRMLCRSLFKKIVQGVLCWSLLSTYSAESVFHIPGGIDPLGGSQRDAEEGFFKRYSKVQSVRHISATDATFSRSRNMHVQSNSGKDKV